MTQHAFTADDYIPASHWAKDHWSTLAFIEAGMVDRAGYQVGLDARMRTNRRNYRVMAEQCPNPKRATNTVRFAGVMDSSAGTVLADGTKVAGHDDWSCVQDFANEGLLNLPPEKVEPGVVLRLSPKGAAWVAALREFKRNGGQFANFTAKGLPEMPECRPAEQETFWWAGIEFDITAIRKDIAAKKLRPHQQSLDASFIANFGTKMLGLDKAKRDEDQKGTMFVAVSSKAALELPAEVLEDPVILARAGRRKGVLAIRGTSPDYVLADGNHRVARAYLDDFPCLPAYILSEAQSSRYRS